MVFRCEVISGEPIPTEEAAEARFLSPAEIEDLMDEAYACRLSDALRPEVIVRSHDGVKLLEL